MTGEQVMDLAGVLVIAVGAFFCLAAAVGLLRFPDVMTRMHAATKPSVFGLILVLLGVALTVREVGVFALFALAVLLQVMTAPVSGHLVSRTAHLSGQWDAEHAVLDELADDQSSADPPPPDATLTGGATGSSG